MKAQHQGFRQADTNLWKPLDGVSSLVDRNMDLVSRAIELNGNLRRGAEEMEGNCFCLLRGPRLEDGGALPPVPPDSVTTIGVTAPTRQLIVNT